MSMRKQTRKDIEEQRLTMRHLISQRYNPKEEQRAKISRTIYNYGFWKGFAIAFIIGMIIGGSIS
jgi:hypothetical protein